MASDCALRDVCAGLRWLKDLRLSSNDIFFARRTPETGGFSNETLDGEITVSNWPLGLNWRSFFVGIKRNLE